MTDRPTPLRPAPGRQPDSPPHPPAELSEALERITSNGTATVLIGLDVGTTDSKVLITDLTGEELLVRSRPTCWTSSAGGRAEAVAWPLVDAVIALAATAVEELAGHTDAAIRVAAIAVTGMAETGSVVTEQGDASTPLIAWFDPRGGSQLADTAPELRRELPAATGLPVGAQVSLAKLLWLNDSGADLGAGRWLHVPELVVHRLGALPRTETSLVARTGLFDQDSGGPWEPGLALLGLSADFLPPLAVAGEPVGVADGPWCPPALRGALLSIAGHDHPVAAVGCDAVAPGALFDSFGTAQVFLRTLDTPVPREHRAALVQAGVNVVRHVLPGRWHLLGGTKSGLILRRTLALLGAADQQHRDRLDALAARWQSRRLDGLVTVAGASNTDGVLQVAVSSEDVDPGAVWMAALRHGIAEGDRLLRLMSDIVGPPTHSVVAGGWTRMSSVRTEKQRTLPDVRFSARSQAGAYGAVVFAANAFGQPIRALPTGVHTAGSTDQERTA